MKTLEELNFILNENNEEEKKQQIKKLTDIANKKLKELDFKFKTGKFIRVSDKSSIYKFEKKIKEPIFAGVQIDTKVIVLLKPYYKPEANRDKVVITVDRKNIVKIINTYKNNKWQEEVIRPD